MPKSSSGSEAEALTFREGAVFKGESHLIGRGIARSASSPVALRVLKLNVSAALGGRGTLPDIAVAEREGFNDLIGSAAFGRVLGDTGDNRSDDRNGA